MTAISLYGDRPIKAFEYHKRVKERYPLFADRGRKVILRYLKKYNKRWHSIFLGQEYDLKPPVDIPERFDVLSGMQACLSGLCRGIKLLDQTKEETPESITLSIYELDAHIRLWMHLPFRMLDDNTTEEINLLWRDI